jgi:hypothetical protein
MKVNWPDQANDNLPESEFWRKVDPLATSFRENCKVNLRPGSVFAINKHLRRSKGRWKHAITIATKADSKGAKIYSLCQGYYCFNFLFASRVARVPEVGRFTPYNPPSMKPFTISESVVLTLILELQQQH